MDISIIVAFDNNAPLMENFFAEIAPFARNRADRQIVLCADCCRNSETMDVARRHEREWDNVVLVESHRKVGYSIANNLAVTASSGDYLLFMNTDIFPEPGAIDALRAKFDEVHDKPLGAVQGRLLYPQNGKVMSTGHCFLEYMNHHLYQGRDGDDPIVMEEGERQALNSAFMMMPADVYAEMYGMDEFFYNAYDGMDLTLRAGRAGYKLLYVPEALVWHSTGGSRDYIRHNNEYQSKYFYAHTGSGIESDVPGYLAPQITDDMRSNPYYAIDCTFCMTWGEMMDELGIRRCATYEIEQRDASRIDLYRNLSPAFIAEPAPLLFVVNHFGDVIGNKRWFAKRGRPEDLIVDFYGNAFTAGQLGLCRGDSHQAG